MSTGPVERLIEAASDADVLADAVERHLDRRPLPVDEAEVERIVDRLEARMGRAGSPGRPASRRRWGTAVAAVGLLVAAAGVFMARGVGERPARVEGPAPTAVLPAEVVPRPAVVRRLEQPGIVRLGPAHLLEMGPGSMALTSVEAEVAVVLVQRGLVLADDVPVPENHWAVLTREDGALRGVVFRDGEAPPDDPAWAESSVPQQLRELRWEALPDRTLDALDRVLSTRSTARDASKEE